MRRWSTSANEALPPPVVADAAEVATGGAKAAALESVIVEVDNVSVTDIAPPLGAGDAAPSNEFVVNGSLRVNDAIYLTTPFPTVGQQFQLAARHSRLSQQRLQARAAERCRRGPGHAGAGGLRPRVELRRCGPGGNTDVPHTPLTVSLSNATTTDTFVGITSLDPASLAVTSSGVTVPAGQTSAQVLVDGLQQAASVALHATLGATTLEANVRVIAATELPVIASITPATASLQPGATLQFTVTLDIPAPVIGSIVGLSQTGTGSIPVTLVIPSNQLAATFDYVASNVPEEAVVTATLGSSHASATVTVASNACSTNHLVISEIRSRGAAGAADEFVELYNPTDAPVTLDSTWKLEARSNATGSYSGRWTGTGKVIPAHGHFLIAGTGYSQTPAADEALSTGITDATSLRLVQSGTTVDAVCYGFDATSIAVFTSDATYTCEGSPVANNPHNNTTAGNVDGSIERKAGGASGNCTDTGDNAADFLVDAAANPQSTASAATP